MPPNHVTTDEAEWVKRARSGDAPAFAELVRRFRTAVYAAAYVQIRNHEEAEDVSQEAFMTAYEKLADLREPDRFGVWVCRIASRLAVRRRKQGKRETDRRQAMSERQPAAQQKPPWQALADGEVQEAVRGLVRELSQINREAIELYHLRGYSIYEIAKFLNVPLGTVKRRLHDARAKLRALLMEVLEPDVLDDLLPNGRNES